MSSVTSTDRQPARPRPSSSRGGTSVEALTSDAAAPRSRRAEAPADAGFRPWQYFVLGSLAAATIAVMLARDTHPVALLVLSAGVLAAGFAGWAIQQAVAAFTGGGLEQAPTSSRARQTLEREKALALRAIKDLEFDHAMGKISDADFADLSAGLRARALTLMQELEVPVPESKASDAKWEVVAHETGSCAACNTPNDHDAKFCKQCGAKL